MLIAVIIINLLISVTSLYVAWRLWKLRRVIDKAAKAVLNADRVTYNVLHATPKAISRGELGTRNVRKRYQQVELQLLRLRQIVDLLSMGRIAILGRSFIKRRPRQPAQREHVKEAMSRRRTER